MADSSPVRKGLDCFTIIVPQSDQVFSKPFLQPSILILIHVPALLERHILDVRRAMNQLFPRAYLMFPLSRLVGRGLSRDMRAA